MLQYRQCDVAQWQSIGLGSWRSRVQTQVSRHHFLILIRVTSDYRCIMCDMWLWHVVCGCDMWYVIVICDMWYVTWDKWYEICHGELSNLLILRCDFFRLFPSWTRLSLYRPIYLVHDPYDRYKTSKIRKMEPVDPSFTTGNVDYTILQTDQSTMVPDGYHLWSW